MSKGIITDWDGGVTAGVLKVVRVGLDEYLETGLEDCDLTRICRSGCLEPWLFRNGGCTRPKRAYPDWSVCAFVSKPVEYLGQDGASEGRKQIEDRSAGKISVSRVLSNEMDAV